MKNANKIQSLITVFVVLMMFTMPLAGAVTCRTYTLDADFDEGTLVGVEHQTVHDQLQLSTTATTLPFIWVPNSNEGTVSKYDTVTGNELGRYRTGPTSTGSPSRTTVDQDGNVWFGNRATGTVVKIGLYEGGQCVDKNGDGVITTSQDTNNDGDVTGTEVLAWGQDECVLHEVLLGSTGSGPRGIAIDANKDLWAGTFTLGGGNNFYHINGATGAIIPADTISISPDRSYGALVDGNGNIWSSSLSGYVLKIDPTTKIITKVPLSLTSYGLGIDSNNHLFVAGWGQNLVARIDVNPPHNVICKPQGDSRCRGVAVTSDGDVWVVNSNNGAVTRLDNNLNWKATIDIGGAGVMSTGAAVDAAGKVWACNYNDGFLHRIDPISDSTDLSKQTPGVLVGLGKHYSYSDMTGIISRSVTTKIGTWTVDYDSGATGTFWGTVSWNAEPQGSEPAGTSITVQVRSSDDKVTWSTWETATNGVALSSTPGGQYLQVQTTLKITTGTLSPVLSDLTVCTTDVLIPEFSTITIPVVSILGLLFFFNHRKRKREQ